MQTRNGGLSSGMQQNAQAARLSGRLMPSCSGRDAGWGRRRRRGMERPLLADDFNHRLRNRLKREIAAPPLSRKASRWLHGYWVFAALLSVYIIIRTDWPSPLDSPWIPAFHILLVLAVIVVEFVPARKARRVAAALGFI